MPEKREFLRLEYFDQKEKRRYLCGYYTQQPLAEFYIGELINIGKGSKEDYKLEKKEIEVNDFVRGFLDQNPTKTGLLGVFTEKEAEEFKPHPMMRFLSQNMRDRIKNTKLKKMRKVKPRERRDEHYY
jgi:hypothetical protein